MGILSTIVGGGVAQPIEAVGNVLDKLFTSDDEKLGRQEALERLRQQPDLAQIELNKIEAAHRAIFVAGWRPFIGWVCGSALAYQYILRDLIAWGVTVAGVTIPPPPALDTGTILTLVTALLGLGGMRTFEKRVGVAK